MGGDIRLFPPTLDGTNYAVWKVRIEAYTMGKKHEVWSMMVDMRKNAVVECAILRIKQIYTQLFKSDI